MQKYLKRILVSIFLLLIFIFGNSCNAMELKERKYSSQYEEKILYNPTNIQSI